MRRKGKRKVIVKMGEGKINVFRRQAILQNTVQMCVVYVYITCVTLFTRQSSA